MKKFSIITLFLALLSMTMQAQENTYNMVIEMANGTKITIGPNDIRSLTFNNGELTVTGDNLQSWMESVAKQEDIDMLMAWIKEIDYRESQSLEPLMEYFNINAYGWDAGEKVSQALVDELKMMLARQDAMFDYTMNETEELRKNVHDLEDIIAELRVRIAELEVKSND